MHHKLSHLLTALLLTVAIQQTTLSSTAYGNQCSTLGHLVDQYLNNAYEQPATSDRGVPENVKSELSSLELALVIQRDPAKVEAIAEKMADLQLKNRLYQEAAWTMLRSGHPELAEKITQNLEAKLKQAEVVEVAALGGGVTATSIVTLKDGTLAVFKPEDKSGGAWSWASHHHHEIAAYIVDRGLGLGVVPITVEATVNGQVGSLQYFIRGANLGGSQTWRMKLLDSLIAMRDRHSGNYLTRIGGQNAAIDHGVSFGVAADGVQFPFTGIVPSAAVYKKIMEVPREYWDRELKPILGAAYESVNSSDHGKRSQSVLTSLVAGGKEGQYNNFLQRLGECQREFQANVSQGALLPNHQ